MRDKSIEINNDIRKSPALGWFLLTPETRDSLCHWCEYNTKTKLC